MIDNLYRRFGRQYLTFYILLMGCMWQGGALYSQFNVKIGYTLARANAGTNNQLLADLNANRSVLYEDYDAAPDLKMMFGIALGARYKFGISSIELNWEGLGRDIRSVGFDKPTATAAPMATAEEIKYSLNMLMITYETSFGIYGIGSSLGRNVVNIKQQATGTTDKVSLFNNSDTRSSYFARFHFALNFKGNGSVAFAIKPFVQIPLSDIELSSVATKLGLEEKTYAEGFPLFGIGFAFYNGRQK